MINKVRNIVKYWVNKDQNGGMPSADEFNSLCALAQITVINNHVKKEGAETYSYDADELSWVKQVSTVAVASGIALRPANFMYLLNIDYEYSWMVDSVVNTAFKNIDIIRDGEMNRRLNSQITSPTLQYPMGRHISTGFEIYPTTITEVRISYIKKPTDPVWAFTQDAFGRPVYDEGSSTDFLLPESMTNEISLVILSQMGINVREGQLTQFAESKIQQE